jgi:hypothetical protein
MSRDIVPTCLATSFRRAAAGWRPPAGIVLGFIGIAIMLLLFALVLFSTPTSSSGQIQQVGLL